MSRKYCPDCGSLLPDEPHESWCFVRPVEQRAEAAEAHAAELIEENRELSESVITLRAEVVALEAHLAGAAQTVTRLTNERDEARRSLDALKRELSHAFNSGNGVYRP